MKKRLKNPTKVPHASSDTVSTSTITDTSEPKPSEQNMEVHHHAHVHSQNKWKEYLFQFFMLFLAVFCGYLAEYRLEQTIEKHREEDYIEGFIKNVSGDKFFLDSIIRANSERQVYLDSLLSLSRKDVNTPENTRLVYNYFIKARRTFPIYIPNDAVVQQLKSSGNFRIIKKLPVVDSILTYDAGNRLIQNRTELYQDIIQKSWESSYSVMDLSILRDRSYILNSELQQQPPPLVKDPEKMRYFFNAVAREAWFVGVYLSFLRRQLEHAERIQPFVKKEYHLE